MRPVCEDRWVTCMRQVCNCVNCMRPVWRQVCYLHETGELPVQGKCRQVCYLYEASVKTGVLPAWDRRVTCTRPVWRQVGGHWRLLQWSAQWWQLTDAQVSHHQLPWQPGGLQVDWRWTPADELCISHLRKYQQQWRLEDDKSLAQWTTLHENIEELVLHHRERPVVVEMLKLSSGSIEYVTWPLLPLSASVADTVSTLTPVDVSSATDTWQQHSANTQPTNRQNKQTNKQTNEETNEKTNQ